MSKETLQDLNTHTLIGHTAARGTAWHYRAEHQGDEPNHYPGPIPVADVARRLFAWQADSRPLAVERPADPATMTHLDASGLPARWVPVEGRQAIVRSDRTDGHVMGVFTDAYVPHQYREWLLTSVANLLDDTLSISSAGLLRDGAIAWVEVSVPESITTPEGVTFRPNLLATTTFDGSLATTYKRTVTDVVCDNTREAALGETGQQIKVRHSRHSSLKLASARQALAMVHTTAEDFAAEVAALCRIRVDHRTFARFLDAWAPTVDGTGDRLTGKALTLAVRKREAITQMHSHDSWVTPWAGTAHAVLQAVNTYEHHARPVRGTTRPERNMLRTVTGDFAATDHRAWHTLQQVLASA
ncbi:DUF932 domain-containing protein [Georgenia sp. AZ-5]|uniref:DUF932 domain-containing protein n=1 Tax=Georgenia sp. AZ-5 TaxID=3367526 RepID=UPI0037552E5B